MSSRNASQRAARALSIVDAMQGGALEGGTRSRSSSAKKSATRSRSDARAAARSLARALPGGKGGKQSVRPIPASSGSANASPAQRSHGGAEAGTGQQSPAAGGQALALRRTTGRPSE